MLLVSVFTFPSLSVFMLITIMKSFAAPPFAVMLLRRVFPAVIAKSN
ncbi:hypothetical protein M2103_002425 [Ereboglobus sp. PH5-5]|nr:hypothetical protein [Ereboglobus sp. PH5-5]